MLILAVSKYGIIYTKIILMHQCWCVNMQNVLIGKLEHISFNIPAYNNRTTPIFYLPRHSIDYLKNSSILRAMTLCNKLAPNIDRFFTSLASILKTYFSNNM